MESPAAPDPPPSILYIVQAPKKHRTIREDYLTKTATVLGLLHIVCGLVNIAILAISVATGNLFSTMAVIPLVFFLISGGLAIGGARRGNKCLVVATLVMSILSAIAAFYSLINASTWLHLIEQIDYDDFKQHTNMTTSKATDQALHITLVAVCAIMLVVSIISSALTCRPLCCRRSQESGTVHYTPGTTNTAHTIPPNATIMVVSDSKEEEESRPSHKDVAGTGMKYERF